jgi:hypothetical protein
MHATSQGPGIEKKKDSESMVNYFRIDFWAWILLPAVMQFGQQQVRYFAQNTTTLRDIINARVTPFGDIFMRHKTAETLGIV